MTAQSSGGSTPGTTVDQNPIRRRGTGLRALDAAKASAGLTLFAPMHGDGTVYLVDLNGTIVHTWRMPYPPGLYGYLTDRGTLFYNGKIPNETFLGKTPFKGGVALEADWDGRILWEVRQPNHHHDGRLLKNGNVLFLCATELPAGIARRVQGGQPGTEVNGRIWADYLLEVTTDGRPVWEWRIWEHLDPAEYPIAFAENTRSEWTHGNAIVELANGDLLISLRNISTILKIDRKSGGVVWKLGAPMLSGQHAPTPLPNGDILIFDNGPHRVDQTFPFSRVIEVNPATNQIVWKFQEAFPPNFYSDRISNAQRLPNGNTLINEGQFGRFFEVTPAGEVVWEYVNPYFGPASRPPQTQTNSVFRVYRYTEDELARARHLI
ncbi:MAG: aryl-sulfate sulfotransferase [Acidobacteriia bacterium]|nr:aryl-sulfate sulfotransferase [Terriglobia bacterium]